MVVSGQKFLEVRSSITFLIWVANVNEHEAEISSKRVRFKMFSIGADIICSLCLVFRLHEQMPSH